MTGVIRACLKIIGLWLLEQRWFQFELVKLLTKIAKAAEKLSERTGTSVDDKAIDFLKRNKTEILNIVIREADLKDTPIDDILVEAVKNVK